MSWRTDVHKKQENEEMKYCKLRKCPHLECARHYRNAPWNVLITVKSFHPDKDWNCKDIME